MYNLTLLHCKYNLNYIHAVCVRPRPSHYVTGLNLLHRTWLSEGGSPEGGGGGPSEVSGELSGAPIRHVGTPLILPGWGETQLNIMCYNNFLKFQNCQTVQTIRIFNFSLIEVFCSFPWFLGKCWRS